MSLILKYSNWLVAAILLFVGTRVLFVIYLPRVKLQFFRTGVAQPNPPLSSSRVIGN